MISKICRCWVLLPFVATIVLSGCHDWGKSPNERKAKQEMIREVKEELSKGKYSRGGLEAISQGYSFDELLLEGGEPREACMAFAIGMSPESAFDKVLDEKCQPIDYISNSYLVEKESKKRVTPKIDAMSGLITNSLLDEQVSFFIKMRNDRAYLVKFVNNIDLVSYSDYGKEVNFKIVQGQYQVIVFDTNKDDIFVAFKREL